MRFIVGGIMHETNTFSREPTTEATFDHVLRGDGFERLAGSNTSLGGVLDECAARGVAVAPTYYAGIAATGIASRASFDRMCGELTTGIEAALPADGLVLTLHGAMVAEGYPDAEAEIVRRARAIVGPGMPIAVTLDFHANVGQAMVDQVQIITVYQTYPHTDAAARARDAVGLLARTVRGDVRPTLALAKPPMMPVPQAQFTAKQPFRTLLDRAAQQGSGAALDVSVVAGFPYADAPETGLGVLAITDDDPAAARRIADELARAAWDARGEMSVVNTPPDDAVAEAIAHPNGPVMLIDVGDNTGGGAPGDGTLLLAELLRQRATGAVIAINDPEAAARAIAAGVGAEVSLLVGGKIDRLHGDPLAIRGQVAHIGDGVWVHEGPENAGAAANMGPTAVVQVDGVKLILTSLKTMPGDLAQLRSLGIEPREQHVIVVKAAVRWRGGYEPIAAHAIHVDTPGLCGADLSRFDFRAVRRPIWPLDPDMSWRPDA